MKDLVTIIFKDTIEEEAQQFLTELGLYNIMTQLQEGAPLTPELLEDLRSLIYRVADIFSPLFPAIDINPQVTLQVISRDINLSRLLRERGLARLYLVTRQQVWIDNDGLVVSNPTEDQKRKLNSLPVYKTLIDPNTNTTFRTQNDFLGWFCREAHVSRSMTYQRLATFDKLVKLGIPLERAFQIIITRPSVIQDTLLNMGNWDRNDLIGVKSPDIAIEVARRVDYANLDQLQELAEQAREQPEDLAINQALTDAFKPLLVNLLDEVAACDSSTDARETIQYDILKRPEIQYHWVDGDTLVVDMVRKQTDPKGVEYIADVVSIQFIPSTEFNVPVEIIQDIQQRLPIKNRQKLDN